MDKKEQILHYHRIDGLSQREIARRVGVSRKTVKRYIRLSVRAGKGVKKGVAVRMAEEPKALKNAPHALITAIQNLSHKCGRCSNQSQK